MLVATCLAPEEILQLLYNRADIGGTESGIKLLLKDCCLFDALSDPAEK
jgi:hypothetical protein